MTELYVDDGDFLEARVVIARIDTALLQSRKRELIAERAKPVRPRISRSLRERASATR